MKTYRYMIGMLLCVWLLAACDNSNAFDEYAKFDTTAQTAWGQSIVDGSNGYVAHVKSDRTYNLADAWTCWRWHFWPTTDWPCSCSCSRSP